MTSVKLINHSSSTADWNCLLADYNQFYIQILLLWREVAEDGAGNGFRDFVHV